jgi:phosphatidylserine/phosphatidylglycerophosphate/cardiolipin synthase-like enzyme
MAINQDIGKNNVFLFLAELPFGKTEIPMQLGAIRPYFEECKLHISGSRKIVRIASPFIDDQGVRLISESFLDNPFQPFLEIVVRLISRRDEEALLKIGAKIFVLNRERSGWGSHAKYFIFDDELCILGSGNLTKRSMEGNFEVGAVITGTECEKLTRIHKLITSFSQQIRGLPDR